jgi:hypothetical protein
VIPETVIIAKRIRADRIREMLRESTSDEETKNVLRWMQETSEPYPFLAGERIIRETANEIGV